MGYSCEIRYRTFQKREVVVKDERIVIQEKNQERIR